LKTYARSGSTNRKSAEEAGARAGWPLIYPKLPAEMRDNCSIITTRNKEEHSMMDVIVLGSRSAFALAIGYTHVCERL
jgi:hypothetical protein